MTETSWQSLAHSRWECKYHVVFIPKVSPQGNLWRDQSELGRDLP